MGILVVVTKTTNNVSKEPHGKYKKKPLNAHIAIIKIDGIILAYFTQIVCIFVMLTSNSFSKCFREIILHLQ